MQYLFSNLHGQPHEYPEILKHWTNPLRISPCSSHSYFNRPASIYCSTGRKAFEWNYHSPYTSSHQGASLYPKKRLGSRCLRNLRNPRRSPIPNNHLHRGQQLQQLPLPAVGVCNLAKYAKPNISLKAFQWIMLQTSTPELESESSS